MAKNTRASKLASIKKRIVPVSEASPYVRALVYGRNGHGKTRFAASGPNTLIVDINEDGTQSVKDSGADVFHASKWEDLTYLYWFLRDGDHSYETVVLDTLTQAQHLCMAHVLNRAEDRDPNRPPSLPRRQDWGQLGELMKPVIYDYRNLRMNVIFTCQMRTDKGSEDDEEITMRYVPDLSPSVRGVAMSAVGVMGYMFRRKTQVGKKVKVKGKTKTKETTVWKTCMLVGPHETYETKDRTNALGYVWQDPTMPKLIQAWIDNPVEEEE